MNHVSIIISMATVFVWRASRGSAAGRAAGGLQAAAGELQALSARGRIGTGKV